MGALYMTAAPGVYGRNVRIGLEKRGAGRVASARPALATGAPAPVAYWGLTLLPPLASMLPSVGWPR